VHAEPVRHLADAVERKVVLLRGGHSLGG
jgi:hypothetical protein